MSDPKLIDHTLLKPTATKAQVEQLIDEAIQADFASVCVNPTWVPLAEAKLNGTNVKVCTVIGFPLGANTTKVKAFEAADAVKNGAHEVDMVINVGAALEGEWEFVEEDIAAVVTAAQPALVKVILETCYLDGEQIKEASKRAVAAGADFVKTSTGFGDGGATVEAVRIMRETVGPDIGVKASGGVRTPEDLAAMVAAGATRIGTSNGVSLI